MAKASAPLVEKVTFLLDRHPDVVVRSVMLDAMKALPLMVAVPAEFDACTV